MGIIRDLKAMGFTTFRKYKDAIGWLQPFIREFTNLASFVGGHVGDSLKKRH